MQLATANSSESSALDIRAIAASLDISCQKTLLEPAMASTPSGARTERARLQQRYSWRRPTWHCGVTVILLAAVASAAPAASLDIDAMAAAAGRHVPGRRLSDIYAPSTPTPTDPVPVPPADPVPVLPADPVPVPPGVPLPEPPTDPVPVPPAVPVPEPVVTPEAPTVANRPFKVAYYYAFDPVEAPDVITYIQDRLMPAVASLLGRWLRVCFLTCTDPH